MNFLRRLFGNRPPPPDESQPSRLYVSKEGKSRGADQMPMLVFGYHAHQSAENMAKWTTINCFAVKSLEEAEHFLKGNLALGIRAMSHPEACGEAGEAIRLFNRYLNGVTFYGAWDYNVERAATRALEYGADGIEMPGIYTYELYVYITGVIRETCQRVPQPTTIEQHRERLKKYTTSKSPFWSHEDMIVSKFY